MDYGPLIDKLAIHFCSQNFSDELNHAKSLFVKEFGSFEEEGIFYEGKMDRFVEWYIFDYHFKEGTTIIQYCLYDSHFDIPDIEWESYKNLLQQRHSLFEILKLKTNLIQVRDIFSKYKFSIQNPFVNLSLKKFDIFEARLVPCFSSFSFTRVFCFHNKNARKFILKKSFEVEKGQYLQKNIMLKGQRRSHLIFNLYKRHITVQKYKHISVEQIYSEKPEFLKKNLEL